MHNTLRSISALLSKKCHSLKNQRQRNRIPGALGGVMTGSLVLLFVFVVVLIGMAATTLEEGTYLWRNISRPLITGLVISATLFLGIFLSVIYKTLNCCSEKALRILEGVILTAGVLLQFVFLFYYRSAYLFDTAFVSGAASSLALTGEVAPEALYYMSVYPNQNAFAVVTSFLWKMCTMVGLESARIPLVLNAVNMISIDVSLIIMSMTIGQYRRDISRAQRVMVLLFTAMNPFIYIGVSYYYTITLSMPFFMIIMYGFVRALRDEKEMRLWFYIVWGAALAIRYLFRATTVIVLIAGVFCLVAFKKIRKKQLIALLAFLLVFFSGSRLCERVIGIDTTDTAFPATHWIMMSMTSPGCHNAEDEQFTASFSSREEKKEAVLERMRDKAQNLGVEGFAGLAFAKMKNTWADGTNGYPLFLEQCLNTGVGYEEIFGGHKDAVVLYHQAYWLLMLLGIAKTVGCSLLTGRRDFFMAELTVLGAFLFYLLWETGTQYSLPFFQIFTILALAGMIPWESENSRGTDDFREDKKDSPTGVYMKKAVCLFAGCSILFLVAFFIKETNLFTKYKSEFTHPIVLQYLANYELEVKAGEEIVQEFCTDQPFNRILFQFRNDDSQSDAVYEVKVAGEKSGTVTGTEIIAKGQPAIGGVFLEMPVVRPEEKENFRINIRKTAGSEDHNLRFVTYRMGAYDAYANGSLTINGHRTTQDLVYTVTCSDVDSYTTTKRYTVFAIMAVLLYTITTLCFMEIWKCRKSQ
ncbi:MAG: hypothetical protein IJ429_01735 [Lachnospiraceae bacterium]|nr:hypothetical protein [Lachnospiraceae bacterium]